VSTSGEYDGGLTDPFARRYTSPMPEVLPSELDDSIFDAERYALPIPQIDGIRATRLDLRFSGSGTLDRTSDDDLKLLEAARLGSEVVLIVRGTFVGKGFRLVGKDDDELSYSATVRVESVEAGELA
jgi:hypothetical protein